MITTDRLKEILDKRERAEYHGDEEIYAMAEELLKWREFASENPLVISYKESKND